MAIEPRGILQCSDQKQKVRVALGSVTPALIDGLNKALALIAKTPPMLKKIAENNRFPDDCEEETKRNLLLHLCVLEYQNGKPDPWYAVHPLVERCRKYREHG